MKKKEKRERKRKPLPQCLPKRSLVLLLLVEGVAGKNEVKKR